MANHEKEFDKYCRFCGLKKSTGKLMFSFEALKMGLLLKIKNSFPEEGALMDSETILPKYICTSCEATITSWEEFRNSVKLAQQNLMEKIIGSKAEMAAKIQENTPHICPGQTQTTTVRCNPQGSILCHFCNVELLSNQIPIGGSCLCICSNCGFKDKFYVFVDKSNNVRCPKCSNNGKNEPTNTSVSRKEFKCDTCHKSYISKGHLNRHRLTHSGSKPFVCSECGASFGQKSTLNTHSLIHKKMNPYSCKWCGQSFRHKQTLSNHVMSIHGINSISTNFHECDKCLRKFVHKDKLVRHYRSHSGEKPFKCDICCKSFSQQVNLKTHYKKHENETQFPVIEQTTSNVNRSSQGDLIQELLSFDNITTGAESLPNFSMVNSQYPEESNSLKTLSTTDSRNMYYNSSTSPYMIYSSNSILYDLDDPNESSALPAFSRLNSPSVKPELEL